MRCSTIMHDDEESRHMRRMEGERLKLAGRLTEKAKLEDFSEGWWGE